MRIYVLCNIEADFPPVFHVKYFTYLCWPQEVLLNQV